MERGKPKAVPAADPVLNNLTNIVKEMKDLFQALPGQSKKSSARPRKTRRLTPRDEAQRSMRTRSTRNEKLRPYLPRRMMPAASSRRRKPSVNLDSLQVFFSEFHSKSKVLVAELERSVLKAT